MRVCPAFSEHGLSIRADLDKRHRYSSLFHSLDRIGVREQRAKRSVAKSAWYWYGDLYDRAVA